MIRLLTTLSRRIALSDIPESERDRQPYIVKKWFRTVSLICLAAGSFLILDGNIALALAAWVTSSIALYKVLSR